MDKESENCKQVYYELHSVVENIDVRNRLTSNEPLLSYSQRSGQNQSKLEGNSEKRGREGDERVSIFKARIALRHWGQCLGFTHMQWG